MPLEHYLHLKPFASVQVKKGYNKSNQQFKQSIKLPKKLYIMLMVQLSRSLVLPLPVSAQQGQASSSGI